MSEKIDMDVNIAEGIASRLQTVASQASHFEEKYPDDDSLVKFFEDVKGVISEFNESILSNQLSDVEIGKKFYEDIDDKYGSGMFNVDLKTWAANVLPNNDSDLVNLNLFESASMAKRSLENIIAKLSKASIDDK